MPGYDEWSKGIASELTIVEGWLNNASAGQLRACAAALWALDDGSGFRAAPEANLMTILAQELAGVPLPAALREVANNWFGIGEPCQPMWFWDCTLSLAQMHLVMTETAARACVLMAAGREAGKEVRFEAWIQCGHPRLRTVLSWPDSVAADADQRWLSSSNWEPSKPPEGLIREWILSPFSAGYRMDSSGYPETDPTAVTRRDDLVTAVKATIEPPDNVPHPERVMTSYERDIYPINSGFMAGGYPWRGTNLAVPCDNERVPQPAAAVRRGLSTSFKSASNEPPPKTDREYIERATIEPRTVSAIEIGWRDAPEGRFPPGLAPAQSAS